MSLTLSPGSLCKAARICVKTIVTRVPLRSMTTSSCLPCTDAFLELPEKTNILLIESAEQLESSSCLVETAYVCGIDAEWEPGLAVASATLLQLAFVGNKQQPQNSTVLLLDLMSLPIAAVKDFLQSLLRDGSTLKVGYGLVHDLWAISAALGDEGLGCVSVVQPQVDVGTLHRQLHKAHVPGIRKVVGKGLSALTEAQLAMPLDKSLQCSSWGTRPLTQAQIDYAALDALCLLMLLDNMISCAPPQLSTQASAPANEAGASNACKQSRCQQESADLPDQQSHHLEPQRQPLLQLTQHTDPASAQTDSKAVAGPSACIDLDAAAGRNLDNGDYRPLAACDSHPSSSQHSPSNCHDNSAAAASSHYSTPSADFSTQRPSCGVQQVSLGPSEHQAAIQQAVEHWACRLEMAAEGKASKPRARRHLSRRQRAHNRHAVEQQNQIDHAAGAPVFVPWKDHAGEPRFLCDVMTEGLAKQLRLYGVDAAAVESKGRGSRHLVYRQMVDTAQAEERVILTCDQTFIRMGYSDQAFYVRTTNKQEQVREVLTHFSITIQEDNLLSRCAKCNGTFYPRPIPAQELSFIENISDVPQHIKELHKEFWVCQKCGQAYWQGSQYGNALQQLSQRLSGLAV